MCMRCYVCVCNAGCMRVSQCLPVCIALRYLSACMQCTHMLVCVYLSACHVYAMLSICNALRCPYAMHSDACMQCTQMPVCNALTCLCAMHVDACMHCIRHLHTLLCGISAQHTYTHICLRCPNTHTHTHTHTHTNTNAHTTRACIRSNGFSEHRCSTCRKSAP